MLTKIEFLTQTGKGVVKSVPTPFAEKLIKIGKAKKVVENEVKPKAKAKAKK